MVQIILKLASPGHCLEWMLVELQGKLESQQEEDLAGNFIGDLHFSKKGVPILIIGHHILYGKVTDLEKPFIILLKNNKPMLSEDLDVSMETNDNKSTSLAVETNNKGDSPSKRDADFGANDVRYKVRAVIKKKMVFKTRPKPIITNVPKKL